MTGRTRTANSVGTKERSDGVEPNSSDLSTITRERDEAVRLLREAQDMYLPLSDEALGYEYDHHAKVTAFLATVEDKP